MLFHAFLFWKNDMKLTKSGWDTKHISNYIQLWLGSTCLRFNNNTMTKLIDSSYQTPLTQSIIRPGTDTCAQCWFYRRWACLRRPNNITNTPVIDLNTVHLKIVLIQAQISNAEGQGEVTLGWLAQVYLAASQSSQCLFWTTPKLVSEYNARQYLISFLSLNA